MKKSTKIGLFVAGLLVCILSISIAILYVKYKESTEVEKPGENYEEIYRDDSNVKEEIEAITNENGTFSFSQIANEERIDKRLSWIKTCQQDVTATAVAMDELERFSGSIFETLFSGFTKAFPKKHKANQGMVYDFQIQNKGGLGEEIYILTAEKDFYDKLPEAAESTIGNVKAKIFYTHNRRTNIKEKKTVDQYVYEAVFVKDNVPHYIQAEYSGFDYAVNMIETTKENTSNDFAGLLTRIINQSEK